MDRIDRYRGCLLGLAAGDALGTTLEFRPPGTFAPITGMVGGGPFGLRPGEWTDDTSLALSLAESLIEKSGFDPVDQLERYVRWYREGHLSSTGTCFDIGTTTRKALERFSLSREPFPGLTDERSAGNGSLMRVCPVPMFYAADPVRAIELSGESSRTTHALPVAVDACRFFGGLILGALAGAPKEVLLSERYSPVPGYWEEHPLAGEIDAVAAGSYLRKEPPAIRGRGYVAASLEAALWAFSRSSTFAEGCLLAVNLGEDADTTGAIYGQLAGAYYGAAAIPWAWRECLAMRDLIEAYAENLMRCARCRTGEPERVLRMGDRVLPLCDRDGS
ncbi:MAG: ADP-ribosylglycohydrolase family protein [Methanoculleus sp.]|uniref:ADP-ribosylglycohydrolase family protein n=1 Tax=unclassified Methanoculleus TaxID=2619537 RepID=UPI0025EC92EE|nr:MULTISPECIES: ADP-ribosylglycohydrolase family protein [unclassified Methanoculleus]MCK9316921.1 ADP-ribosylglycohydrolase family protein [Methanoculleus sp.]MDD2253298.1 ADP-ribosylglycohydrolase family protein [Methanoculleus sp.]MDD3215124.1 ADP-ribosylglycohydrolase family protein [Methanoculleus sp.]MDD4313138.1 ADP-ribosylglycohydrolase family protein [Methanoculleus sp.]MDD4470327.1 ADP-ribosylglycohydrolase family protein [Methanoculleus sp.]